VKTSGFRKRLTEEAQKFLEPDEEVLGGTRALPDGFWETRWWFLLVVVSVLIGLIVAIIVQRNVTKKWMEAARRSGFEGGQNMALVLTGRRLLICKRKGRKLKELFGTVPLTRISSAQLVPGGRPEIVFSFVDAVPVTIETFKADDPEALVRALSSIIPPDRTAQTPSPPPPHPPVPGN